MSLTSKHLPMEKLGLDVIVSILQPSSEKKKYQYFGIMGLNLMIFDLHRIKKYFNIQSSPSVLTLAFSYPKIFHSPLMDNSSLNFNLKNKTITTIHDVIVFLNLSF